MLTTSSFLKSDPHPSRPSLAPLDEIVFLPRRPSSEVVDEVCHRFRACPVCKVSWGGNETRNQIDQSTHWLGLHWRGAAKPTTGLDKKPIDQSTHWLRASRKCPTHSCGPRIRRPQPVTDDGSAASADQALEVVLLLPWLKAMFS